MTSQQAHQVAEAAKKALATEAGMAEWLKEQGMPADTFGAPLTPALTEIYLDAVKDAD